VVCGPAGVDSIAGNENGIDLIKHYAEYVCVINHIELQRLRPNRGVASLHPVGQALDLVLADVLSSNAMTG